MQRASGVREGTYRAKESMEQYENGESEVGGRGKNVATRSWEEWVRKSRTANRTLAAALGDTPALLSAHLRSLSRAEADGAAVGATRY
jgi:hypothetical protein